MRSRDTNLQAHISNELRRTVTARFEPSDVSLLVSAISGDHEQRPLNQLRGRGGERKRTHANELRNVLSEKMTRPRVWTTAECLRRDEQRARSGGENKEKERSMTKVENGGRATRVC